MVPSPARRARLLDALALGFRGDDEESARVYIGFTLGGFRLLADEGGAPIAFDDAEKANAICDLLAEAPFDQLKLAPVLVPAWRNWGGLPDEIRELGEGDEGEAAAAAVITAGAIAAVLRQAPGWAVPS